MRLARSVASGLAGAIFVSSLLVGLTFADALAQEALPNEDELIGYEASSKDPNVKLFLHEIDRLYGEKVVKRIKRAISLGQATEPTCTQIELIIILAKELIRSELAFREIFFGLCAGYGITTVKVCSGIADLFSPPLYFILSNSKISPREMATILLGPQCMSKKAFVASALNWNVEIPNRLERETAVKSVYVESAAQTRFLHLTDIHIDLKYSIGSSYNCTEPLCCRADSNPVDGASPSPAGRWGEGLGECDSPKQLGIATLEQVNRTYASNPNQYSYILWTGDTTPHDVWLTTKDEVLEAARTWTSLMKTHLPPGVPLFPVLGNHEGRPVNMFSPPEITGRLSTQWIYDETFNQWGDWIGAGNEATFRYAGYYAINATETLRIVGLNTNLCARQNFWQLYDPNDPGQQLRWLAAQLDSAERAGQAVHIVGHIPIDGDLCTATWYHNYLALIERYSDVVTAKFFGHTHQDEVRVYYSSGEEHTPLAVGFVGGSITTFGNVNPCYKIFTLDGDKGHVLDQETYYFNMSAANENNASPAWNQEYAARTAYAMQDQSPGEWDRVVSQMNATDAVFQQYYQFFHRFSDSTYWAPTCDGRCKSTLLNRIKVTDPLSAAGWENHEQVRKEFWI